MLLDLTTALVATHGEPPADKSAWDDTHCLEYLLYHTMMALLRGETRLLAAVATHLNGGGWQRPAAPNV